MAKDTTTMWADAGLFPSQEAMRDHLLIGLLRPGIPDDTLERLAAGGIRFQGDFFGLMEIQVIALNAFAYIQGLGRPSYSEAELSVNMLERMETMLADSESVYPFKIQSELYCMVCGETAEAAELRLRSAAGRVMALEQELDGIRMFGALSAIRPRISGLSACKEAVRMLTEYRVLHLDDTPILHEAILSEPVRYPLRRTDIEQEQEALTLFKSGNYREAAAVFGGLFDREYLLLGTCPILLKHKCAQYLDSLVRTCKDMIETDFTERLDAFSPEKRLMEAVTYPEIRAQMEHTFGYLNDLVLACRRSESAAWIMDVKNYIRGNFSDPDLNVNRVADEFSKNPSYLSRCFLRLTGTSILDYIHHYRIQEAKILIGRGVTLAVAAEAVGYSSVLTMSRAFKKYEGTTPGKLRA